MIQRSEYVLVEILEKSTEIGTSRFIAFIALHRPSRCDNFWLARDPDIAFL